MDEVIAVRLTFFPEEVQAYPMVEYWTNCEQPGVWPYTRMCQPPVPEGKQWLDVLKLSTGSQVFGGTAPSELED